MQLKLQREFYTVSEVAQLIRMTPHGVRKLLADGRLAAVRPGGVRRVLIPRGAVQVLLSSNPHK